MSRTFHILLSILIFSTVCQAQDVLSGTVLEQDTKEILPGAFVYVYDGQHILKYAVCDDRGCFSVTLDESAKPDHIVVSFIGFKSASVQVHDISKSLVIQLQPQKMELNGAMTTASALEIHSDTLSYIASAFADGSELSAGDLIKKIPGLAVTNSGGITYQGVPINKFYVEGMDLMNSSYGVVTKNLSADKIARVEVYKNHQPKKVLVGVSDTDRSAVNIILKETARNTLMITGDMEAGAGRNFLFDGKAMLTRFSPSEQDLFLAKGNDIGRNIISEITSQQYFGRTGAVLVTDESIDSDFLGKLNPRRTILPIPQEYWYDNISGVISFNHLKKINNDLLLRGSLHIAGEKYSEQSFSMEEIHFSNADSLIIEEDKRMSDTKYFVSGNFAIEKNSESDYLSDILTISGQLRKDDGLLLGGDIDKTQFYDLPSLKIENNLDVTMRAGEKIVLEIKSDTKYVRNNHQADYKTGQMNAHQLLDDNSIKSLNNISTKFSAGIFQMSFGGGVNLDYQSFNSQLEGIIEDLPIPSSSFSEFADINPNVFLSGSTRFRRNDFSFRIPVEYHLIAGNVKSGYLSFKPSLRFENSLSSLWKVKASASYSQRGNDMENMLPVVVMGDYRSLSVSSGLMKYRDTDAEAGLEYSDDLSFAYASIAGVYHKTWTDKSSSQLYSDDLTISTYISSPVASDNYGVRGSLTKYFGLKVFVVKINGGYMRYDQNFYLQGIFQSYKTDRYDANAVIRFSPVSWLSLEAAADYACSQVFGDYGSRHSSLTTRAALSVFPVKSLVFNFNAFWMKENTAVHSVSNMPLVKIDAAWTLKHFTITAECRNILNSKEFRRSYIDTYRSSSYSLSMPGLQALVGIRLSL